MSACAMKFHKSRNEEILCADHKEGCERGALHQCEKGNTCLICGLCPSHCIGHLGVKEDLLDANNVIRLVGAAQ